VASTSAARGRGGWLGGLRELYGRPSSALGTSLVAIFLVLAVLGPLATPYGATQQVFTDRSQPPSPAHPFGTDHLGRDVFSRVVAGDRDIFLLAGSGTLIAVLVGTLVGLFATYRGGWSEEIAYRLFDSLLAVPALLLALLLLGSLGPSRSSVLAVIAVAYTPIVARVVRSVVLDTKTKEYVLAARMQGESTAFVLGR